MFGLMRAKKCGMSADEKNFRRLHYCGTCKTIGSLYGQKSRLLLNHDTVFLSEILTGLSNENINTWEKSYQSFNCLSLPKTEMPVSLQFAATANIILSEFKLADHIADEKKKRFKIAHRIFSREFLEAEKLLKTWNFPLAQVQEILQTQEQREAENSSLDTLAEPTAKTTALFFSEGVKLIGKAEVENLAAGIGAAFGKLIYLIDAFEDYEKDFKAHKFNAIRSTFNLSETKIPADIKRKVSTILNELEDRIVTGIYELPIRDAQKAIFASRLQQNLQRQLQTNLPVLKTKKVCAVKPKQTVAERWRKATETARNMARNYSWQMPLVFIFVLVFALVAPAQSRGAKSARECFDLSFNLMFLGAIFGSAVASIGSIFAMDGDQSPIPPSPFGPNGPEAGEAAGPSVGAGAGNVVGKAVKSRGPRRKGSGIGPGGVGGGTGGGNSWCCCGFGDCCDCCDCAECGCDSCECCGSCGECGSCCDCCSGCDC